jgi:hypothetical protein
MRADRCHQGDTPQPLGEPRVKGTWKGARTGGAVIAWNTAGLGMRACWIVGVTASQRGDPAGFLVAAACPSRGHTRPGFRALHASAVGLPGHRAAARLEQLGFALLMQQRFQFADRGLDGGVCAVDEVGQL